MAMEARGYSGANERSKMYPLEYSSHDRWVYALSVIILILAVAGRIAGIL